jgi:CRP-like cAMP-binding protein
MLLRWRLFWQAWLLEEVTLSVVEGGSIFGEMALTDERLGEEVSARALVPSLVCTLKTEDVRQLIESNPRVGLAMVRMLSERLREASPPNRYRTHAPCCLERAPHLAAPIGASRSPPL